MQLPGGFSPMNAIKQVGSVINPTGGVTNYDVFGNLGDQRSGGQVQGASTDLPNGAMYYNEQTGQIEGYENGQWTSNPSWKPDANPNPTTSTYTTPKADPYARWGGQSGYTTKRNNYGATQGSYEASARTGLRDVGNEYETKNNAFADEVTQGQEGINSGLAGNQLNLRRSMEGIIRMIQQGIRSGGVALANMNAGSSGASDALARAYAKVGNQQTGDVRGDAALQEEELQKQQGALNLKRQQGEQSMGTWRDTETDRVKSDFGSKLQVLRSQADSEGLGDTVNTGLVDQVLSEALQRLASIDQQRSQKLSGVRQWTPDEIMKEAIRLDEMGTVGTPFSFEGPDVRYGGSNAPQGSDLPLYVKNKDQLAVVPSSKKKS